VSPRALARACHVFGCGGIVPCSVHGRAQTRVRSDRDGFYSRAAWRRFRLWVLHQRPLCEFCQRNGVTTLASEVHHLIPLRVAPERGLDATNVVCLCRACHARETLAGR
jgi:5-methylcytosine-specific restriction protein A